jgi:hypothetical protein
MKRTMIIGAVVAALALAGCGGSRAIKAEATNDEVTTNIPTTKNPTDAQRVAMTAWVLKAEPPMTQLVDDTEAAPDTPDQAFVDRLDADIQAIVSLPAPPDKAVAEHWRALCTDGTRFVEDLRRYVAAPDDIDPDNPGPLGTAALATAERFNADAQEFQADMAPYGLDFPAEPIAV